MTANNCHTLPIVITQMIAQLFPSRVIILIIGGNTHRCTDISDGQILNQMQV